MKKRFKFQCWNCPHTYTLFRNLTEEQELLVACPYCGKEAVVKLNRKEKKIGVFRGEGDGELSAGFELDLPDILPTQKPD